MGVAVFLDDVRFFSGELQPERVGEDTKTKCLAGIVHLRRERPDHAARRVLHSGNP